MSGKRLEAGIDWGADSYMKRCSKSRHFVTLSFNLLNYRVLPRDEGCDAA